MEHVFQILAAFFIVAGTVKLARSRGRHPWMWGGTAMILSFIPNFNLLGMIPLVILLVMRRGQEAVDANPARPACPKCNRLHSRDHHYCTNCGWQLNIPYFGEASTDEEQVSTPLASRSEQPTAATAVPPGTGCQHCSRR